MAEPLKPLSLYHLLPEQPYRVDYYYVDTPRYVRMIERVTRWWFSWTQYAHDAILSWCDTRKTRYDWPNGTWGDDIR